MSRRRIYLASPLGFATSTSSFLHELVTGLETHVDIENPWDDLRFEKEFADVATIDSSSERKRRLAIVNRELGRANAVRIEHSDAVFAVLDGVDVDSGTAAEIGYAVAKGKYVCGLRTDFRLAGDNEGSIVNLQVQYFIESTGGRIVTTPEELFELASTFASGVLRPD